MNTKKYLTEHQNYVKIVIANELRAIESMSYSRKTTLKRIRNIPETYQKRLRIDNALERDMNTKDAKRINLAANKLIKCIKDLELETIRKKILDAIK